MTRKIKLRYFNENLPIGLVSWQEGYILKRIQHKYLSKLIRQNVYMEKGSGKIIGYNKLKNGLRKTTKILFKEVLV
jgi:hypothetical protein